MPKKAVVFCGDFNSHLWLETAIKSVTRHNSHIRFYIINEDFPQEWFAYLREYLDQCHCDIQDIKIPQEYAQELALFEGTMPYQSFFRFLIPLFIPDERVLYLDTDVLVTQDLAPLFEIDLQDKPLGAIREPEGTGAYLGLKDYFNAGVLLINNKVWQEQKIYERLVQTAHEKLSEVLYADQSILNLTFQKQWLPLSHTYNYLVGLELNWALDKRHDLIAFRDSYPAIAHFAGPNKPWKTKLYSRFRDLWWRYHDLNWIDIVRNVSLAPRQTHDILLLVSSDQLLYIEEILQQNKEVTFHIAAHTLMSPKLKNLIAHSNCKVYESISDYALEEILDKCQALLEISPFANVNHILERGLTLNKTIISWEDCWMQPHEQVFSLKAGDLKAMKAAINQALALTLS
ncbi:glycosyltransferase family 8 protein [Streptococcus halichoeri]|uniref:glycosyltransferase family 8 protein n=1 Tax=Streptococcus halichoeri TaxID=254785 RepID=UPI00135903D1|nr:glycosyltransferase family 8 protein [Streptococcus halichoeri]